MSLSVKNGWLDKENRVYIYYTAKEVMEDIGIAKEKCSKIFAELDSEKGCGLIIRIRQGLGKPDMIYVMNFLSYVSSNNEREITEFRDDVDIQEDLENKGKDGSMKIETQEVRKSKIQKFENRTSGSLKIESQEVRKSNTNNTELNISSYASEIGKVEDRIQITKNIEKDIAISFSAKYMMDALKTLTEEELLILLNNDSSPIIIKSINDESLIQLILPIKTY
jgi:hypothetical protein